MLQDDQQKKQKNGNSLAAGIAIGAALGAAAVALKNKNNQEKVKNTVRKVRDWADTATQKLADKSDDAIKEAQKDLESIRKEIKEPKD